MTIINNRMTLIFMLDDKSEQVRYLGGSDIGLDSILRQWHGYGCGSRDYVESVQYTNH